MAPGLKIPNDDEEFDMTPDQTTKFFENTSALVNYLKMLPFEDKPFYFESEEEAIELWKKHFPPG